MVSMSEIQKDCFVCDHCNKALSDSKFVAIHDAAVFGQPECKEGCKEYVAFFESGEPEELAKAAVEALSKFPTVNASIEDLSLIHI